MRLSLKACAALTAALVALPAGADLFRPSVKDQIELGQKAAAQVRKEERILRDSDPRVRTVRRIGMALVAQIPADEREKRPFQYSFDVIDSPEINAFALPGGPVFFYRGLLDALQTEDQVAGVLAHELAHVRSQHWASAYADNQKRRLGLSVLLILLNANATAFDIASVTDELLFRLPYSRRHETEADRSGYNLMATADFNPQGMADVFKVLRDKGGSRRTEEWASTHPDINKRIAAIEARIAESGTRYPAQKPLSPGVMLRTFMATKRPLPVLR
jgi:predicted Zn-dependent protease